MFYFSLVKAAACLTNLNLTKVSTLKYFSRQVFIFFLSSVLVLFAPYKCSLGNK